MAAIPYDMSEKEAKFWRDFSLKSANDSDFICPSCQRKMHIYSSGLNYYVACLRCYIYATLLFEVSEFKKIV